jgi:hypothetical protein
MAKSFPNTGTTVIDATADLPASPSEGMMVFQKDTNELKIYDGASWVSMLDTDTPPAIQLVNPTSVTNGTNTNGNITFSAVTSVSVNGCFSSAFDHYKIMFDGTATATNGTQLYMRMRTSGTDYSGGTYYFGGNYGGVSGTIGAWNGAAVTQWHINHLWGDRCKASIELFKPFTTIPHVIQWQAFGDNNSFQVGNAVSGSELGGTARDGFTFFSGAGTFAGSIRVYGYRNSI